LEVFGKASADTGIKTYKTISDAEGLDQIRGAKILLVEDNEINQQVARELLEREGFVVDIANDGQEGVNQAHSSEYDVVLMDIQMPVMGGYEATRQIRKDPKFSDLPILAMTANAMVGDREKALDAGMNDHIAKPIDPKELFSTLIKWIEPGDREVPENHRQKAEGNSDKLPEKLPGIDIATGITRVGGNAKLYQNLLNKFSQNQATSVEDIKKALEQDDMELAERLAHTIKGVSGNIGAMDLHIAARDLETGIKEEGKNVAGVLLESVQLNLDLVLGSIQDISAKGTDSISDENGPIDLSVVEPLIKELTELLKDDDTEAANIVEKLQVVLRGSEAGYELLKIEKLIGAYDFEEALTQLVKVEKTMNQD